MNTFVDRALVSVSALSLAALTEGCDSFDRACDVRDIIGGDSSHLCLEFPGFEEAVVEKEVEKFCEERVREGRTAELIERCSTDHLQGTCSFCSPDGAGKIYVYEVEAIASVSAEQYCASEGGMWTP